MLLLIGVGAVFVGVFRLFSPAQEKDEIVEKFNYHHDKAIENYEFEKWNTFGAKISHKNGLEVKLNGKVVNLFKVI